MLSQQRNWTTLKHFNERVRYIFYLLCRISETGKIKAKLFRALLFHSIIKNSRGCFLNINRRRGPGHYREPLL
jgi:hypothetical protein